MSPLANHAPGTQMRIARIDAGHEYLHELATYGIVPGALLHLRSRTPAYVVKVGETTLAFDTRGARRIWVVPAHEGAPVDTRQNARPPASMILVLAAVIGLLLVLLAAPAFASHPLVTDDAGTQGAAGFEAEFNGTVAQARQNEGTAAQGVSLHLGLSDTVDLGLNAGYEAALASDGAQGMGDPSVDLKWRMVEQAGARPAIGLRVDYVAPQSSPMSDGMHEGALTAAAAWDFERRFVYANGTLCMAGAGAAAPAVAWAASAAFGERIVRNWYAVVDARHEANAGIRGHATAGLLGVQWQQRDGLALSFGGGPSLDSNKALGWMATLALTLSFAPRTSGAQLASNE